MNLLLIILATANGLFFVASFSDGDFLWAAYHAIATGLAATGVAITRR